MVKGRTYGIMHILVQSPLPFRYNSHSKPSLWRYLYMKAAQIDRYGDASVMHVNDIPRPSPRRGQVLVEVHAASLNPFDTTIRNGSMKDSIPLDFPATIGGDLAGIVIETSEDVKDIIVGEAVYGQAYVVGGNSGAFAEYAVTAASRLARSPAGLTFTEAASLPLVGVSAFQALTEHLSIKPGHKLFIHGGAGGIGTVAIQIAKHIGAHVATTATGEGAAYAKTLGADEVIDYKAQDFAEVIKDFDAVFDTVGGDDFNKSLRILKRGGRGVSMIAPPDENVAHELGVVALMQGTHVTTGALNALTSLVEQGIVTPHVGRIYPLEGIQEAFVARESGTVHGKIVLKLR